MIDVSFDLEEGGDNFAVFIVSRDSGTEKIISRELMGIYESKREAGVAVNDWLRCDD